MKKLIFLGIAMACCLVVSAQDIPVNSIKYFGGSGEDYGQFTQVTNDGNVLLIGWVRSGDGSVAGYHGGSDIWVVKLSPAGNIIWQRTLGGSEDETAVSYAYNTTDGSVIIAANTNANSANGDITLTRGMGDIWLAKLDNNGNLVWQKTLGGSAKDICLNIINTSDGNYLLSAETQSTNSDVTGNHGSSDIWLVKMNTSGTVIWKRCYGGSGMETGSNGDAYGSSLIESSPGSYIFSANTSSANGDVTGYHGGLTDAWIVKTNVSGNITWQTCIGGGGMDISRQLRVLPNSLIVVLAQTSSPDMPDYHPSTGGFASNFDVLYNILGSDGTILKQKCFGSSFNEIPVDLVAVDDYNIVFAAKAHGNGGDITNCHAQDKFSSDIWLCKINENGDIKWQKCLGGSNDEQQAESIGNTVAAHNLYLMNDKGILFAGISRSSDGDVVRKHPYGPVRDYDIWLVNLDSLGNILSQKTVGDNRNEWIGGAGSLNMANNTYFFAGSSESYNNNIPSSSGRMSDIFFFSIARTSAIEGVVYIDSNRNTIRDNNEPFVKNANVLIEKTGFTITASSNDAGHYYQLVDTGKYVVSCTAPSHFAAISVLKPIDHYYTTDTVDFPLRPVFATGMVYFDNNSNGTKESDEPLVDNASLQFTQPGFLQNTLTNNGNYYMALDTGQYTIKCVAPKPYFNILPVSATSIFTYDDPADTINFALAPIPNIKDLAVAVTSLNEVRPDSSARYSIHYFNQGTDTIPSGTVLFKMDNRFTLVQSTPAADIVSGDTLKWLYSNFKPFEKRTISLVLKASDVPVLNPLDTIQQFAAVLPVSGDNTPSDNKDTIYQVIAGAAVLLEKTEHHKKYISQQEVADTAYLIYTIRFQNNTGSSIDSVKISDTLDVAIDSSSLQMISASHNYKLTIQDGKKLTWEMYNIVLPDCGTNPAACTGYVSFRIRLKRPVATGTLIPNRAYISLDSNTPSATNTITREVGN